MRWIALTLLPFITACAGGDKDDPVDTGPSDVLPDDTGDSGEPLELPSTELPSTLAGLLSGARVGSEVELVTLQAGCGSNAEWRVDVWAEGEATAVVGFVWDVAGEGLITHAFNLPSVETGRFGRDLADTAVGTECGSVPVLFGAVALDASSELSAPAFEGWFPDDDNVIVATAAVDLSARDGVDVEYAFSVRDEPDDARAWVLNPLASTLVGPVEMYLAEDNYMAFKSELAPLGGEVMEDLWVGFHTTRGGETDGLAGT